MFFSGDTTNQPTLKNVDTDTAVGLMSAGGDSHTDTAAGLMSAGGDSQPSDNSGVYEVANENVDMNGDNDTSEDVDKSQVESDDLDEDKSKDFLELDETAEELNDTENNSTVNMDTELESEINNDEDLSARTKPLSSPRKSAVSEVSSTVVNGNTEAVSPQKSTLETKVYKSPVPSSVSPVKMPLKKSPMNMAPNYPLLKGGNLANTILPKSITDQYRIVCQCGAKNCRKYLF